MPIICTSFIVCATQVRTLFLVAKFSVADHGTLSTDLPWFDSPIAAIESIKISNAVPVEPPRRAFGVELLLVSSPYPSADKSNIVKCGKAFENRHKGMVSSHFDPACGPTLLMRPPSRCHRRHVKRHGLNRGAGRRSGHAHRATIGTHFARVKHSPVLSPRVSDKARVSAAKGRLPPVFLL
jgi:hypothetical protein